MEIKKSAVIAVLVLFALVPFASADLFDLLTGKVTSAGTNVTVEIASVVNTTIPFVNFTTPLNLNEGTNVSLVVVFRAEDADGAVDINVTSGRVNITKTCGSELRARSATCTNTSSGELPLTQVNFTCTVTSFQYYDCPGSWVVNATVLSSHSPFNIENSSTALTVNNLDAVDIYPLAVTFPALTGGTTNIASVINNTVNNTGNRIPNLELNSTNLRGNVITTDRFNASDFDALTSNGTTVNNPCSGVQLQNYSFVSIGTSLFGSRPLTNTNAGNALGQAATVRYCIPSVPYVLKQNYTTNIEGAWTIKASGFA